MANGKRTSEPSLLSLVNQVKADATRLVNAQVALTKAELSSTGQEAGKTGALLIGAGVLAFLGFVFVLVTLAYVLVALGLPTWAGFGIVALLLIIVAAVLGLLGRRTAQNIKGPVRAQAELEKTLAVFKGGDAGPAALGQAAQATERAAAEVGRPAGPGA